MLDQYPIDHASERIDDRRVMPRYNYAMDLYHQLRLLANAESCVLCSNMRRSNTRSISFITSQVKIASHFQFIYEYNKRHMSIED